MTFSYSSDKFYHDWRFRIEQDFVKSSGGPFDYAKHGLQNWGDERFAIPFPSNNESYVTKCVAISDNGKYIAVSADFDVKVYNLEDCDHLYTLKGHVSQVDCIAFRPGSPDELVSAAMGDYGGSRQAIPEVIFWNLKVQTPNVLTSPEILERLSRNAANSILAEIKSISRNFKVGSGDHKALADAVKDPIAQYVVTKGVADNPKISGRIMPNFQSQNFSPSGKALIYLPGSRPPSNDDDDWEFRTYSVDEHKDINVFSGHRDTITWAGFNHDETLIGTAAWDGTFRIWDASNGQMKHLFLTGKQNWTGGFSPDGKYFAGTDGDGTLHVYNLSDGTEHMTYKHGSGWARAIAWHPNKRIIALGTEDAGKLLLLDVDNIEAIQKRILSTQDVKNVPEEWKKGLRRYLAVYRVEFVDDGRKLAFFTSGDGSAEVYDLEKEVKWRFARAGTMNPPEDDSEVTSKGGFAMAVYEDRANKKVTIISADDDRARVWSVPRSS